MINKTRGSDLRPFSGLTPEVVLDAAAAFGRAPAGRPFAPNRYGNPLAPPGPTWYRGFPWRLTGNSCRSGAGPNAAAASSTTSGVSPEKGRRSLPRVLFIIAPS